MKTTKLLSVLLVTTMLAACGGGNATSENGGGNAIAGGEMKTTNSVGKSGGGESSGSVASIGTGGGDSVRGVTASKEVNPFANNKIPKTKESIRIIDATGRLTLTLDPVRRKFSFVTDAGDIKLYGDYDPKKLTTTQRKCYVAAPDECAPNGTVSRLRPFLFGLEGDGLVLLGKDGDGYLAAGHNPTKKANLPSGRVIYNGKFALYGEDCKGELCSIQTYDGDARTVVNFDTDKLSTKLTYTGYDSIRSAEIKNVSLKGSKFAGGNMTLKTKDGKTISGGKTAVKGEFYGKNGQELGGAFEYQFGNPEGKRQSYYLDGAWNGTKK